MTINHLITLRKSWAVHRAVRYRVFPLLVGLWLSVLLTGCNVNQYLADGDYLYNGSSVSVIAPDSVDATALELELNSVLDDNSNTKTPLLGYYEVWRYLRQQEKRIGKPQSEWKDDKGEAPIYFDDQVLNTVDRLLGNRAMNAGYFFHRVESKVDTTADSIAVLVNYSVYVSPPHRIDSLAYYLPDTALARIVTESASESLLLPGVRYDLDLLRGERLRIEKELRRRGYYYFQENDLTYLVDTVTGDREVDLLMKFSGDVPPRHLTAQRITRINVFPDIELGDTTLGRSVDTIIQDGIRIICENCPLRPTVVGEAIVAKPGELYDPLDHEKTLQRLASYNMFRYVSLDYDPINDCDTSLVLNAYMQPKLRRRMEGELGVSYNNARYFGPEIAFAYENRNLLRGAELLRIEGNFSYAFFLGDPETTRVPRSGTYGLTASLNVPRLWLPWRRKILPRVMTSGTNISIGGRLENLTMNLARFGEEIEAGGFTELAESILADSTAQETVNLFQFSFSYGYNWQRRTTKRHQLNPFTFRYQNPSASRDKVLRLSRELGLAGDGQQNLSRFDRMLLWSPNYTYTYDSRLRGLKTHNFFWQQYLSMNVNQVFPPSGSGAENELSVYPQLETDMRYYLVFNKRQMLAARLHGGIAYPFSERAIVPYFDLYTIGGPNSLRGFIPRQLGPGRTVPVDNNLLTFGGYGNVLLEASIEFRQRLNDIVEVAAFADIGNIWTYRTELEPLDSDFRRTTFLDELAYDAGVGLRLDFEFILFRLDLAKPLGIPYEDVVLDPNIPDPPEVDRSIKFILAFGYPF